MQHPRTTISCGILAAASALVPTDSITAQDVGGFHTLPFLMMRQVANQADFELAASGGIGAAPLQVNLSPTAMFRPNAPDFRLDFLFDPADLAWVDIDAFSTGNDNLPVDTTGKLMPGASDEGWASLLFSMEDDAEAPEGTAIYERGLALGGTGAVLANGGDVYSIGIENSDILDDKYLSEVWLERTAEDIDSNSPSFDLEGFDIFAALQVETDGNTESELGGNNALQIYFSVSPAAVAALPSNPPTTGKFSTITHIDWPNAIAPVDAAHVYRMTFDQGWGPIEIAYTRTELGLATSANVDAIAVRPGNSIIFSTDDPTLDDFLVRENTMTQPHDVLKDETGATISSLVGLPQTGPQPRGSVDAICGIDPEVAEFSEWIAAPCRPETPITKSLSLSMSRACEYGLAPPQLQLSVSGWGSFLPQDGAIHLFAVPGAYVSQGGTAIHLPPPNVIPLPPMPRSATEDIAHTQLPIPMSGSGNWAIVAAFVCPAGTAFSQPAVMGF